MAKISYPAFLFWKW